MGLPARDERCVAGRPGRAPLRPSRPVHRRAVRAGAPRRPPGRSRGADGDRVQPGPPARARLRPHPRATAPGRGRRRGERTPSWPSASPRPTSIIGTGTRRSFPTSSRASTRCGLATGSGCCPTGAGCPTRSAWGATSNRWSSPRTTAWSSRTRAFSRSPSASSASARRRASSSATIRSTTWSGRSVPVGPPSGSTATARVSACSSSCPTVTNGQTPSSTSLDDLPGVLRRLHDS